MTAPPQAGQKHQNLPKENFFFFPFPPFNFFFLEQKQKSQCQTKQKLTRILAQKSLSGLSADLVFRLYNVLYSFFKLQ